MENFWAKIHEWFNIPYRLHVQEAGSGPIIIMLHGIATSSESWSRLLPLLTPRFRCITIDLLGFGQSPKPDWYGYTPDEHIKNIHHTIKRLRLNEPFILMGHSMGSLLALHYANKYPQNVGRLALLSPPVYLTRRDVIKARKVWRDTLYSRAYRYFRTHKTFTIKGSQKLKRVALKDNPFLVTEETWLAFSKSLEECIEKQNVKHDLKTVTTPVDIFYGSLDQLIIGSNIRKLDKYSHIGLHKVRSGHTIGVKYSLSVAAFLNSLI
jgi:pimeloyl-ACP methyl ester carboxylesterase